VNSFCEVDRSILLHEAEAGRHCRIRRAIVDAGVKLPEGSVVGYDLDADRARGWHVTEGGVVVVPSREATYGNIAV
jgi:glucose-1-phosphate adenylyltransferase